MESARITSQFDSFTSVLGVADGEPCPTIETSDGLRNNRSKVSRNNRFPTSKKMRTALAAVSLFTRSIQKHTSSRKKCFSAHTRAKTKTPRSIGSRQRVATPFGSPKLVLRLFLCQEAIARKNLAEGNYNKFLQKLNTSERTNSVENHDFWVWLSPYLKASSSSARSR